MCVFCYFFMYVEISIKTKDDFVNLFIFYFWHTQQNNMLCNSQIVK